MLTINQNRDKVEFAMSIDKDKQQSAAADNLRRRAEDQLGTKTAELHPGRAVKTLPSRVHELEVCQIELEMQNNELRRSQEELELSRNTYVELYDFAPVGYFTFDTLGLIREVNLTGAKLLGTERGLLLKRSFSSFIADADGRRIFSDHLALVAKRKVMLRCEIRLAGNDGARPDPLQGVAALVCQTGRHLADRG